METTETTDTPKRKSGLKGLDITDPTLLGLLQTLELDEKNTIPLSLCVNGVVICGQAVPHAVFGKRMSEVLKEKATGNGVEFLTKYLKAYEDVLLSSDDVVAEAVRESFVCLIDARVWPSGEALPAVDGPGHLFRVRTRDINAWTIGTFGSPAT